MHFQVDLQSDPGGMARVVGDEPAGEANNGPKVKTPLKVLGEKLAIDGSRKRFRGALQSFGQSG
jgi:hypothetical protein